MEEKNIRKLARAIFWEAKKSAFFLLSQPLFFLGIFIAFYYLKLLCRRLRTLRWAVEKWFGDFTYYSAVWDDSEGRWLRLEELNRCAVETKVGAKHRFF